MQRQFSLVLLLLLVSAMASCGEEATPTPVSDPTLTATLAPFVIPTFTPVPTLSAESATDPGESPTDELAFLSQQGGEVWLYTVAVDGSGLIKVSEVVSQWDYPKWSPDGKGLAFLAKAAENMSSLCVVWESEPSPVRFTTDLHISSYAWSPESDRIAFSAVTDEEEEDIYLLSLDTLALVNVTSSKGIAEYRPVWSPTGTQMAFESPSGVSSRSACPEGCKYKIYVMDIAGIAGYHPIDVNPSGNYESECDPTWSADGRYLAFIHGCYLDGNPYLFDSQDGSTFELVTDWRFSVWEVEWISEDELSLFYPHEQNDRVTYKDRLYAINRSGENMRPLFPGANLDVAAGCWTGDHRLYAWHDKTSHEIFIGDMTTNQSVSMRIRGCDPKWAPSGDWMAFTTECLEDVQESDVWVVRRDGSGLLNLTGEVPGDSSDVAWRP